MAHAAAAHVRINHSLLAQLERRSLLWLAHRLPAAVHADHLTALAVVGTAIAVSFALARLFPVTLIGVAFFDLQPGLKLAVWPRASIAADKRPARRMLP